MMAKREKKVISHEGWKTTRSERINYYIGDLIYDVRGTYSFSKWKNVTNCARKKNKNPHQNYILKTKKAGNLISINYLMSLSSLVPLMSSVLLK